VVVGVGVDDATIELQLDGPLGNVEVEFAESPFIVFPAAMRVFEVAIKELVLQNCPPCFRQPFSDCHSHYAGVGRYAHTHPAWEGYTQRARYQGALSRYGGRAVHILGSCAYFEMSH
jgi:hypothetical protein